MTKENALTALLVLTAALLTTWALGAAEGKPAQWADGFLIGGACAVASLVGAYRRAKRVD